MKRIAISLAGAMVLAATPALAADSQTYDFSGFTGVKVSAGYDAEITVGGDYSVRAEARDGGDLSKMEIGIKGDTLRITRKREKGWGWNNKGPRTTVYITMPDLRDLDVSSGADASASGVKTDNFSVEVSSGGGADVTGIDANTVSVDVSSGADADLSGTCDRISADSSSGASADAKDLVCRTGSADGSSGSSVSINVSESVTADVSSGASVRVYGNPEQRNVDKSSGGSVRFK